ncbi:MAG: protein kinase [Planctomycetota bacterium]
MTEPSSSHINSDYRFTPEDLSGDSLILRAPRDPNGRPTLSGIPLIKKIGQGGMGAVYYGVHPRLNNEVAIKVLPFHFAEKDPTMIKRFVGEARIAAQVKSPHVVNVIDINEEAGIHYLVMEFVSGMSASDIMKKLSAGSLVPPIPAGSTAVPEWAALDIVISAAEGLKAAHAYDIIHRDLKPDNILIPMVAGRSSNSPLDFIRAKIADLGLAKTENSQTIGTMANASMGTPGYMPPEQVMDAKTASKASDIFAMGATLYSLLRGSAPFSGASVGQIMIETCSKPHPPLSQFRPDVSAGTLKVIDYCLEKEPANRYPNADELLVALKQARSAIPDAALSATSETLQMPRAAINISAPSSRTPETLNATSPTLKMGTAADSGYARTLISDSKAPKPSVNIEPATHATIHPGAPKSGKGLLIAVISFVAILIAAAGVWFGVLAPKRVAEAKQQAFLDALASAQHIQSQAEHITDPVSSKGQWERVIPAYQSVLNMKSDDTASAEGVASAKAMLDRIKRYESELNDAKKAETSADAVENPVKAKEFWAAAHAHYSAMLSLFANDPVAIGGKKMAESKIESIEQQTDGAIRLAIQNAKNIADIASGITDPSQAKLQWKKAITEYDRALAIQPDAEAAKQGKTAAETHLVSIDEYEKKLMLARNASLKADSLSAQADKTAVWNESVSLYADALTFYPNASVAKDELNAVKEKINAFQQTQKSFSEALSSAEAAEKAAANAPTVETSAQYWQQAVDDYIKALRIYYDNTDANAGKSRAMARLEAVNRYSVAMQSARRDQQAAYDATAIDAIRNYAKQAVQSADAALVEFPDDPIALEFKTRITEYLAKAEETYRAKSTDDANKPNETELAALAAARIADEVKAEYRNYAAMRSFIGHTRLISSYSLSQDGRFLVTASRDKTAIVWNLETGNQTILSGHEGYVHDAKFSPDGTIIATASSDNDAGLWNARTGERLRILSGHTRPVSTVRFSSDGKRVLTASADSTAKIWDAGSGSVIVTLQSHTRDISFAEFNPRCDRVLTASLDKTARLWDAATGQPLYELSGLNAWVEAGGFSPNGEIVWIASTEDQRGTKFSQVQFWDAKTGKSIQTLTRKSAIKSGVFTQNSEKFLAACEDNAGIIWDIKSGNIVTQFIGHTNAISSAVLSPDERVVATGSVDKTVNLWNATSGELIKTLDAQTDAVDFVLFSPVDGSLISICRDKKIVLWNSRNRQQ